MAAPISGPVYALRLTPGQDLRTALATFAQSHQLQAGVILTAVGSLQQAALRFAGADAATVLAGPFEIVSLVGTLSVHGLHLHGAVSGPTGETIGGHIMAGCRVHTTVELAIADLPNYRFKREIDPATGYRELVIDF
ncbi:DUF296 domain-containing protein [filamentous cyanobacterium CCP5]|nr:DUF296 domain-containing protein [filamentous cyanobacterium CCP5]